MTRTVRFSAGHHYGRDDWSAERNRQVFGAGVHPHGHNYEVQVKVSGEVEAETGFLVDLGALDLLLEEQIRAPFDQRDLNQVIEPFRTGATQPSTEELAHHLWRKLVDRIPGAARLVSVVVRESDTLSAEVRAE
ncbi:MAG: 6-carboxytetrahydropterin synthase [Gemmatimonadota bacterium]